MLVTAHPLVTAEWPWVTEVPAYDFQVATDHVHLGVYVRRVSGHGWHRLTGLINHVVVAPEARGKGHGTAAVVAADDWLDTIGVPFALLHSSREGAGFYRRLGYVDAPNFPAPTHRGERVSLVAELELRWPSDPVVYVEPW